MKVLLASTFAIALVLLSFPSSSAIAKKGAGRVRRGDAIRPLLYGDQPERPKHHPTITSLLRRGLSYIYDDQSHIAATATATSSFDSTMTPPGSKQYSPSLFQKERSSAKITSSETLTTTTRTSTYWDEDFLQKVINVNNVVTGSGKDTAPNTNAGTGSAEIDTSGSDVTLSQSTKVRQKLLFTILE